MSSLFSGVKSGFKSYFTNSTFSNIQGLVKSKFGSQCNCHTMDEQEYSPQDIQMAFMISNISVFILIVVSIVLGFIAVGKICKDPTERGKNTRLGLYAILLLTGGQVGWIYILLWVMKIDLCI